MSIARARSLRKRLSPPEARLWTTLRREPFANHHFRRQVPIGPYYADFASHSAKLVIEVDGGQHFTDEAERHDEERDAFLPSVGYDVVRVSASEVLNNLAGVAELVLSRLPPPGASRHPPLEGEGAASRNQGQTHD